MVRVHLFIFFCRFAEFATYIMEGNDRNVVRLLFVLSDKNYKNAKEENQMEKQQMLKVAGLVTTALGFAVTLVSSWIEEKQLDATVAEKVAEAVKKAMENGGN